MNRELQSFVDGQGRLTAFPARRKKQLLALSWLADRIPAGREYSEREFGELLDTLHTFRDPATLRRELFDLGLVDRNSDGAKYRLNPDRPGEAELLAKYCR